LAKRRARLATWNACPVFAADNHREHDREGCVALDKGLGGCMISRRPEAGSPIGIREAKVPSEPKVLIRYFSRLEVRMTLIGLEGAGLAVELLATRYVRDAFKAMPVKTDRSDARGIAQLMRLGWFRPVHGKSLPAQELRAVLTGRKLVQGKWYDVEMSLRGILRSFGLKVGPTTAGSFERRIRELVEGHATPVAVTDALLLPRVRDSASHWASCRGAWSRWHERTHARQASDVDARPWRARGAGLCHGN
jgi:transposase